MPSQAQNLCPQRCQRFPGLDQGTDILTFIDSASASSLLAYGNKVLFYHNEAPL